MTIDFFYPDLFTKRMHELAELRYRHVHDIDYFDAGKASSEEFFPKPDSAKLDHQMRLGDHWSGRNAFLWLKKVIDFPKEWQGQNIIGIFDFGETGGGHNSGFESLLFVDGKTYQGVDSNHQEVLFGANYAGKSTELAFYLWSGYDGGGKPREMQHTIKRASIACLDPHVDNLYFWTRAILGSINVLEEAEPEKHLMMNWLKKAFSLIDYTNAGSDEFYASAQKANEYLTNVMEAHQRKLPVQLDMVGHTHIDLAWLWQIKNTREKAIRSFSTVDRLMQTDDEYVFFHSTPQLYDFVKSDHPELYGKIKDYVSQGRWEVGGAMWVEADCNISSGESLARQLLYGCRFFEQEFNQKSSYLWLPDVFGYSWCLPQLLQQCDIDTFYTTKISWNEHNKLPHDSFVWQGMDGSEVLVHFITAVDLDPNSWYYTYNAQPEPRVMLDSWRAYKDKAINQNLLLPYGHGDGGGGVNRHMLEMRRKMDKIPAMPAVKTGRVDDFTQKLHSNIKSDHGGYVHRWNKELYFEYHRGTYTSQALCKWHNRKLELELKSMELMMSMQALEAGDWSVYPQEMLEQSWKTVLRNQFHDIIPGSSITEVYEDTHKEYQQTWQDLKALEQKITHDDNLWILNDSSFVRDDMVFVPKASMQNLPAGSYQETHDGCYLWQEQVAPLSISRVKPAAGAAAAAPFTLDGNRLSTPYYDMEWNGAGQIIKLMDKQANRSVLAANERGNILQIFEDKPRQYDAWEMEVSFKDKMEEITQLTSVKMLQQGALFADIEFVWTYNKSTITQIMRCYAKDGRIDFITHVDWMERQKMLKTAFVVDVHSDYATYDVQFGNCRRPTHRSTSWDHAQFEVCGHFWADLSQYDYGVALLNDCKYGYDILGNQMRLTLLKSPMLPDLVADKGKHHFTYSIYPHKGSWQDAAVDKAAYKLNQPLRLTRNAHTALDGQSLFNVDCANVMIDAVKKAEDHNSVIIRLHEAYGARATVKLGSCKNITSWQECNLLEAPKGAPRQGDIILELSPYEIKTLIINF